MEIAIHNGLRAVWASRPTAATPDGAFVRTEAGENEFLDLGHATWPLQSFHCTKSLTAPALDTIREVCSDESHWVASSDVCAPAGPALSVTQAAHGETTELS